MDRRVVRSFSPPDYRVKCKSRIFVARPQTAGRAEKREWPVVRSTGRSMTAKMAQEDGVERARTP